MAVTNRLATIRLSNGQEAGPTAITPPGDGLVLRLVTTQIGSSPSQASMSVQDAQGRNMGKVVCQDGDDKRISLEGFESGDLTFIVECNLGTVDALVDELTETDAILPSSPGGTLGSAAVADGSITAVKLDADAVTTVKILDANVTTAKIADLNVTEGKLALGVTAESPAVIADPTGTGTITPLANFTTVTMADSAGLRVLADPAFSGQVVVIEGGGANDPTLTPETGDWNGTAAVATFGDAADGMSVIGIGAEWRITGNRDVALA